MPGRAGSTAPFPYIDATRSLATSMRKTHPKSLSSVGGLSIMTLLPSDAVLAWRRRGLRAGLCLALLLPAGTVSAQTLEEALAQAYNNNPVLQARRASLRSL